MSDNYYIIDGLSIPRTFRSTDKDGVQTTHHNIDKFPAQHIDAFSRVRVSNPAYRFDSQFTYGIDADLWDIKETGDGDVSHDTDNRMAVVSAGATLSANEAILQAHYHSPYSAARGQLPIATFNIPTTPTGNGEVGVGYFDGENGVFLKKTASALTVNLTTTTDNPDESVAQADWNIDTFGAGALNPSGLTLDLTKTTIFANPFQALYAGEVTCFFDIAGDLVPFHVFNHSNVSDFPYIAQASLPIRYWAKTTSDATAAASINAICSSVISEGGADLQDIPGRTYVASNKLTFRTLNSVTKYPLLAIECVQQLGGINQNAVVIPSDIEVTMSGNPGWIDIILRPAALTAGGVAPTWSTPETGSTVRFSVNADVVTGGTVVGGAYISATAGNRVSKAVSLLEKVVMAYSHLLAKGDQLVVAVTTTGNATGSATAQWKEIR